MVTKIRKCRNCGSEKIYEFLYLGSMPLPNGFIPEEKLAGKEAKYELAAGVCRNCSLMQLTDVVDPKIMFKNYVYIPSTSNTRLANFRGIVEELIKLNSPEPHSLAVDIGSNDGSLLLEFKKRGVATLGIDPAENLSKVAELKGIRTVNAYFSKTLAEKLIKTEGRAHYITATNVIAHIDNLHDFFTGISILLRKDGLLLCEFPYVVDLLQKNLFDTVYQEHLSYFSVKPLIQVLHKHDLKICDIRRTTIDGGALRLIISGKEAVFSENSAEINKLLNLEKRLGLDRLDVYKNFGKKVRNLKKEIIRTLKQLKKKGKTIAGYGAAARGNILMNYCNIGRNELEFIVDSTPYKQGLYTPGTKIRIYPEEEMLRRKPDYVLILAWNFAEEIIAKQKKYQSKGGKFIIPVPYVQVI